MGWSTDCIALDHCSSTLTVFMLWIRVISLSAPTKHLCQTSQVPLKLNPLLSAMKLKHSFIPAQTSTHLLSPWPLLAARPKPEGSSRVSTVLPLSTQALLRAEHLSSEVSTTLRVSPLCQNWLCPGSLESRRSSPGTTGTCLSRDTLVSLQGARAEPSKHNAASNVQLP